MLYEIMIVGSQSILGEHPHAPDELLFSMEADMFPLHRPELSDVIDGSLGELSIFEKTFGYYAQGVDLTTAKLPLGWKNRVVKIQNNNTDLKIGFCLETTDLAASKLAAFRDKDKDFVTIMIRHKMLDLDVLKARLASIPGIEVVKRREIDAWITQFQSPAADIAPEFF